MPFPATSSLKFITALQGAARSSCQNAYPPPLPLRTGRGSPRRARPSVLLRCAWVVRRLIGDHLCFMQLPCCYRLRRVAFQHGTTERGPISLPSEMGIPSPPAHPTHPRDDETSCLHLNHGLIKVCLALGLANLHGAGVSLDDLEPPASLSISHLPAGDAK